jgi:hypothetical protein
LGRPFFSQSLQILSKIANSIFKNIRNLNVYRAWDDLKFVIPLQTLPRDDGTTLAGYVYPLKNFIANFIANFAKKLIELLNYVMIDHPVRWLASVSAFLRFSLRFTTVYDYGTTCF